MEEEPSVAAVVAALEQDPANDKAIVAVSKNASVASFSQEFVSRGGLFVLFQSLKASSQRASRANVLRALTLLLEDKWTRKALEGKTEAVTTDVLCALLGLVMSDTVLSVARALHVLSVFTEPLFANKERLMEAFALVANERGRAQKPMSCLRCAFVGFALLDANIHGLDVARHLIDLDSANLAALEEASVLQAIFPLCENDALTLQVATFQVSTCRCWRERASILVQPETHPDHMQLLERLWVAIVTPPRAFPGKTSSEWKLLGFQGESPASDFRSMGLLALDMLVYFAETCTTEARMIFSVQNAAETEFYYPVATAGIIVSCLVLGAVESRVKSGSTCPVVLAEGINKLWVAVFRHLDTIFVESKLTYLQFGDLTKTVASQLNDVLAQNPLSSSDVAAMLKAASDSSPTYGSSKKKRNKALSAQWIPATVAARPKEKAATSIDAFVAPLPLTPVKPLRGHGRETRVEGRKLRKACVKGDAKLVIEILGHGKGEGYALVNDPDPDTRATPLHLACHNGHSDCVRLIAGAGAALESVASGMGTPLHCAASIGNVDIATVLIDSGAKLNSLFEGKTPLMAAALAGQGDMCIFLVSRSADVNMTDSEGNAAGALWAGNNEQVAQLLGNRKKRVSVMSRSSSNDVPLPRSALASSPGSSSPRSWELESRALRSELAEVRAENAELKRTVADMERRLSAIEQQTRRKSPF